MHPRIQQTTLSFYALFVLSFISNSPAQALSTTSNVEPDQDRYAIIYVDDDNTVGPWDGSIEYPYQTIQDGIDHAADGDTVMVLAGYYLENLIAGKQIKLHGQEVAITTIDGGGIGYAVYVTADGVTIENFTVTGAAGIAAIELRSNYNTIQGNRLTENDDVGSAAIDLSGSSNNTIAENVIESTYREGGIWINSYSYYNTISRNLFRDNDFYAVVIWGRSTYNTIDENVFIGNHGSIWIMEAAHNSVLDNVIADNRFNAIRIKGSAYTTLIGNAFPISGGISIDAVNPRLEYWNTHTIENNRIDGAPIYYFKDADGVTVPADAAQIILANCTNSSVTGLTLDKAADPIQLGYSSYCEISGNTIACDWYSGGVFMTECDHNLIQNNDMRSTYTDYMGSAGIDGINSEHGTGHVIQDNLILGFHNGIILREWEAEYDNLIARNVISSPLSGMSVIRYMESAAQTTIRENTVYDCGSRGVSVYGWYPLALTDNRLIDNDLSISNIPREGWGDVAISGNTLDDKPIYYFYGQSDFEVPSDGGRVILAECTDFRVEGLHFSGMGGVQASYCSNGRIAGNVFENAQQAVKLEQAPDNVCCDNVFIGCWTGLRIDMDSDGNLICNNVFTRNDRIALFISASDTCRLIDNVILGTMSTPGYGTYDGVLVSNCDNNLISGNLIGCFSGSGLMLQSGSSFNRIEGNTVASCGWSGITFYDNNITGNVITANNLVNNARNAWERDTTTGNSWNDGGIGNYWSDYAQNPGYPTRYEVDGPGDGIDWFPLETASRCPFAPGDLDGSCGEVDFTDAELFFQCWDLSPEPCDDYGCSDLNADGQVNLADLAALARLYGNP